MSDTAPVDVRRLPALDWPQSRGIRSLDAASKRTGWLSILFALIAVVAVASPSTATDAAPASPSYRLTPDGRAFEIQRPTDAKPVRVEVIDRCKPQSEGKIRGINMGGSSLKVRYDKNCEARVNLKTLEVDCSACE